MQIGEVLLLILANSPVAQRTRAHQESQKPHSPFYFASPATCWPPQPSKDKMFVHYFRAGSMALHPPYAQTEGCSRLRLHVDTTAALLPASPGRQGFLEATITLSLRGEKAFASWAAFLRLSCKKTRPTKNLCSLFNMQGQDGDCVTPSVPGQGGTVQSHPCSILLFYLFFFFCTTHFAPRQTFLEAGWI